MECWKLTFDNSGKEIITCGELGVVKYYDVETSENNIKLNTVEAFATCIAIVIFKNFENFYVSHQMING